MFKALIFDMDGVLADTSLINTQSYNLFLKPYHIEITPIARKKYIGRSMKNQFELWQQDYGVTFKESYHDFKQVIDQFQQQLFKEQLKPNNAFLNDLKTLKDQGIKIGVATSSTKDRAAFILQQVGVWDFLDAFVNADDVEKHKPAPDLFLEAAKRLEVKPQDCIVIEDAVNGIEAAKAAGMRAIARISIYHSKEDFKEADGIINDLIDLKPLLADF